MAGDEEFDDWNASDEEWGHFLIPPPPPPPSLGSVCSENDFYCQIEGGPMGAHYNRASFPSLPIIAVCSSIVLVAVLVASFLFWRHKTKAQNLLPCKNEQPGHLGELGTANGVSYEDVLINLHPTRIPQGHPLAGSQTLMPLEIIDVKLGEIGPPQISALHTCYNRRDECQMTDGKHFHPVYEEVSQAPSADKSGKSYESDFDESGKLGGRSLTSEDDFADDDFGNGSGQCSATSSVRGSTGGDLCRDPVSSDEGNGEDCDYMVHDLPEMLPSNNSFNYSSKHGHLHAKTERPDKLRGNLMHGPRDHRHGSTSYLHSDRTANMAPPTQRIADPSIGHKLHSKSSIDRSPHHAPSSPFIHSVPEPRSNFSSIPTSPQWRMNRGSQDKLSYPANNSSQENIYSTIDDDDVVDYPVHPPLASLVNPQRGSPSSKYGPGIPKNVSHRGDRPIPPLSQRNTEENGSYGDIMPTYNSAFM